MIHALILHRNPYHLVIAAPKSLARLANRQSRVGLGIYPSLFLFHNRVEIIFFLGNH